MSMMGEMFKEDKETMMKMMDKIKGCCMEGEMPMMSKMMVEMMPKCLGMMLPSISKEDRTDFVLKMVSILTEQGRAGMSEGEKKEFLERVIGAVKTEETTEPPCCQ